MPKIALYLSKQNDLHQVGNTLHYVKTSLYIIFQVTPCLSFSLSILQDFMQIKDKLFSAYYFF